MLSQNFHICKPKFLTIHLQKHLFHTKTGLMMYFPNLHQNRLVYCTFNNGILHSYKPFALSLISTGNFMFIPAVQWSVKKKKKERKRNTYQSMHYKERFQC